MATVNAYGYEATIILDSIAPSGGRLTSFQLRFPRFILPELNTHRMLSRSSSSSRAIPVRKMVEAVESAPVMPLKWLAKKPGMQGGEELPAVYRQRCEATWEIAVGTSVQWATWLDQSGAHKQHANRVLEPYSWQTTIVSATEWDNFFTLRNSPLAQPEFQQLASMMQDAYNASEPRRMEHGEWHLPYLDDDEKMTMGRIERIFVSAARCARVSYLTHDGERDVARDLGLAQQLLDDRHMSPFEHQAMALGAYGWREHAKDAAKNWINHRLPVGNLWGWSQARKELFE